MTAEALAEALQATIYLVHTARAVDAPSPLVRSATRLRLVVHVLVVRAAPRQARRTAFADYHSPVDHQTDGNQTDWAQLGSRSGVAEAL